MPDFVMARYLKDEDPEKHVSVFPELIDTYRADTIEELAEKLGLPVEATVASFNRYYELCEKGEDVKGLYAAGNLGGQFFGAPDYPFFHPGLSLGHAVTFGYIAGEHAALNK